jgi:hypothetical protein
MFLLTSIGWTLTSLGNPTHIIWPSFSPVNSNFQWLLSPSGSFQSKDIDLAETLMLLMARLLSLPWVGIDPEPLNREVPVWKH